MSSKENLPEKLTCIVSASAILTKLTHFHGSILGNYRKLVRSKFKLMDFLPDKSMPV